MDSPVWIAAIIAVGIAVVFVASVLRARRKEQERTDALRAIAPSLLLSFSDDDGSGLLEAFKGFHLFSRPGRKRVRNVLRGSVGDVDIAAFDYSYVQSSGKHTRTYRQTVVAFSSSAVDLPSFALRPETFFHRIGGLFGYQDIDFENQPAFSKNYLLRGADETRIRHLFSPPVLAFFEETPGLGVEGDGGRLIVYKPDVLCRPENMEDFLAAARQVFTQLVRRR